MPNELPVLDHGFVALESHMGSDLTVVNAARVSFAKRSTDVHACGSCEACLSSEAGKPHYCDHARVSDADAKLIRYLAWHDHWTPFGHPQITLRLKLPIFVARQWMRSNVGIVYNEMSRRYVDDTPELHHPSNWRRRADNLKQGSIDSLDEQAKAYATSTVDDLYDKAHDIYNGFIGDDVAPEQARIVLPLSTYTEFWMTASLAALARVVSLRLDPHAQWEVQQYAKAVDTLVAPLFPVSWPELLTVAREVAAFRLRRYEEMRNPS